MSQVGLREPRGFTTLPPGLRRRSLLILALHILLTGLALGAGIALGRAADSLSMTWAGYLFIGVQYLAFGYAALQVLATVKYLRCLLMRVEAE